MENFLAKYWLQHDAQSSVKNWLTLLYAELFVSVGVMIALPAILLFKRRRREGDDAEPLEHRLRMVDWHMQKEIDRQIQLYKKELHQQKKKKREEARLSHGKPVAKKNPKDKDQPAGKKDPEAKAKP